VRPGITIATAREIVDASFDVAVEIGLDSGGAMRIRRIAELSGGDGSEWASRDIFVSSADAGVVSFSVTGTTPRLAQEFESRGIHLDAAMFARARPQ
jgi:hypothetical protein